MPVPGMTESRMLFVALALTISSLTISPGCALWNAGTWADNEMIDKASHCESTPILRRSTSSLSHQSHDSLSLSVEFRHVPLSMLDETTWSLIDETALPADVRQAWLSNGLRIGLIDGGDPLADAINNGSTSVETTENPVNAFLAGAELLGKQADGRKLIPLRPAKRHELPLSPPLEGRRVLLFNQTSGLVGEPLDSPQLLLALTARRGPREGQVTLEVRPEIHHGAVRQQFVSSDTAVRIHAGRERMELLEMNLEWIAQSNATLIIAPATQSVSGDPTFGLGRQMLNDEKHLEDDQHLIALIRIKP